MLDGDLIAFFKQIKKNTLLHLGIHENKSIDKECM